MFQIFIEISSQFRIYLRGNGLNGNGIKVEIWTELGIQNSNMLYYVCTSYTKYNTFSCKLNKRSNHKEDSTAATVSTTPTLRVPDYTLHINPGGPAVATCWPRSERQRSPLEAECDWGWTGRLCAVVSRSPCVECDGRRPLTYLLHTAESPRKTCPLMRERLRHSY